MKKADVLVIAENHESDFYSSLINDGSIVKIVSSRKSLNFIRSNHVEIILLDCGRDGTRGIRHLRDIKKCAYTIPVIFLTDVKSDNLAVRAYKIGVRDYYKKPVNVLELRTVVKNLLNIKRASKERREPLSFIRDNNDFAMTGRITSDIPTNIMRAVLYIEDNISNTENLHDIAGQANLSKYHFSRVFKKLTGLSPIEFVSQLKINKAKELLRKKDLTVSMVAEEVGYDDLRSFERLFKRHTGLTPISYKKSCKSTSSFHQ
jgi:YesN/AraC family two-component response regulator